MSDLQILLLAGPARLGAVRLVAVDGPSGAGKSTLAGHLAEHWRAAGLTVAVVPTDDFATWTDPVSWWPALVNGVLLPLRANEPGRYRRMDWSTGVPRPGEHVDLPVPDVLLVEGVSSGRRSVRPLLTSLAWVPGPPVADRLARVVGRDGESTRSALLGWQRFERGWFAVDAPERAATVVVSPDLIDSEGRLLTPHVV